jgi:hypothetical protein
MVHHCEYWRRWELEFLLLPQLNLICLCISMYCWSFTHTFTRPSDLNKFTLLELSPYWMCFNQLSSWCKQPHPLLTRHELTHITLSISEQSPDCLATLLLHQYKQFSQGCPWACYQSGDILADDGFVCQYSMHRETIKGHSDQSGHIRDLAWSLERTTKQVANIWHTFQMINLIDVFTHH